MLFRSSVSFISPPLTKTGHPHYGSPAHFEAYVKSIVEKVRANRKVWEQTAILITYDEGGAISIQAMSNQSIFSATGPVSR